MISFFFNRSCTFREPGYLNLKNISGFILNVPSDYKISFITLPLRRRHWITIRELNGLYYNLDSKLDSPQIIGKVTSSSLKKIYFNYFYISGSGFDKLFKRRAGLQR